jgi:hypothetical protein
MLDKFITVSEDEVFSIPPSENMAGERWKDKYFKECILGTALKDVVKVARKYRKYSVCHCPDKSHKQMLDGGLTAKNCECYGVHLDDALYVVGKERYEPRR